MSERNNRSIRIIRVLYFLCSISLAEAAAIAQGADALFQQRCASCHNATSTVGAPLPETLRQMSWQSILAALETGKMTGVGNGMTAGEREAIAKSIGKAESPTIPASAKCPSSMQAAPNVISNGPDWNGWSDGANTRFQSAQRAGLTTENTPKLK